VARLACGTACSIAAAAQVVPMIETNWLRPCGNFESKYGELTGAGRVSRVWTGQVPSASCVLSRNRRPR
jgi:hypothetical protein